MGKVIITLRLYPENVETDLNAIVEEVKKIIQEFGGEYWKHEEVPIAFGLKALEIKFTYPDQEFKEEEFLNKIKNTPGVNDAEIVNVTLSSV
ncbi:MAG TPA: elongation factor 1-beta [Candidatus Nanopusillus sp.]|nr:elongation factor 1-beta [Candidatus Nanopusillus sp.]HIP90570.1 elongation factor 1-beta [Candidatus Nanopusillus sp.]